MTIPDKEKDALLEHLITTRTAIRALWRGPGLVPFEARRLLRDINDLIDQYFARQEKMLEQRPRSLDLKENA